MRSSPDTLAGGSETVNDTAGVVDHLSILSAMAWYIRALNAGGEPPRGEYQPAVGAHPSAVY
jgi:hypothetical protein